MFCMTCGNKLADNARFCMTCGTPVKAVNPAQAQDIENVSDAVVSEAVVSDAVVSEAVATTEAVSEELSSAVSDSVSEVKEDVYNTSSELKEEVAKAEAALESAVVEKPSIDLESTVDTSLDPDVLKALETPDIPDVKEEVKEVKEKINLEPVTPIIPVVPENKIEVTPVIPVTDVAQPQIQPAPSMNSQPVQPVTPASNSTSQPESLKPAKKEHEAFKFFAIIGVIMSIVATTVLDIHSFVDYNDDGSAYDRVDKLYEYTEGIIIIAAMAIALVFLFCRLSSFALSGIVASWVAYGIFIRRFYYDNRNLLSESGRNFKLGIGSFVLWAGLVIALAGIFIKFGKKKMFKI